MRQTGGTYPERLPFTGETARGGVLLRGVAWLYGLFMAVTLAVCFSYGGSSMMTMFAAMGLVSGVKYKLKPKLFSLF